MATNDNGNLEVVKCEICGKILTNDKSVERERGHLCNRLIERGYDAKKLADHRQSMTVKEIPADYVKLSDAGKIVRAKKDSVPGLSVNKLVTAIGRDRTLSGAVHPIATPLYDSRGHRWINPWLMTKDGLQAIASQDFSKAPATK